MIAETQFVISHETTDKEHRPSEAPFFNHFYSPVRKKPLKNFLAQIFR